MFKFEDKALRTSFNIGGANDSLDTDHQFLPILVMKEKLDKEDFLALPCCPNKAQKLGSSQGTRPSYAFVKKDNAVSNRWHEKGHYLQGYTRANSLQWEADQHYHVKKRIMIYLCGGYKGKINKQAKYV